MSLYKKLTGFLSKGFSDPESGAFAYSCVTLLVALVGIVRERILASTVGPGLVLDAYVVAHKIPDILYMTTAALFVSTTLLPYIIREQSLEKRHRLMSEIYTVQSLGSALLAVILIFLTPYIIPLIAPGFSEQAIGTAINMTRVMLFSPILLGISNILSLVAHTHKQFVIIALSPLIYNIGMTVSVWIGYDLLGYWALPLGIFVAALLHMSVQLFAVRSWGAGLPQWVKGIDWQRIRMVLWHALPRAFALAMVPLTALGIIAIGSQLPEGSVSLLNFAIIIQNVPVTLIGASMAVASFPILVELAVAGDSVGFSKRIASSIRLMTVVALPVIALLWVLRHEVVQLLLSSGRFTIEHGYTTAALVGILVLGIWAQSIVQLSNRIYYAYDQTWSPFIQSSIGMAVSLSVAYFLGDVWGVSLVLLATALVVGWWVNAIIAAVRISNHYVVRSDIISIGASLRQAGGAAVVAVVVGLLMQRLIGDWATVHIFVTAIVRSLAIGVPMLIVMIAVLWLSGNTEIRRLGNTLRRRLSSGSNPV